MYTITAYSQRILVNDSGKPLFPNLLPEPMKNVEQFDIKRLTNVCNRNEIRLPKEINYLALGYWTDSGQYVQPIDETFEVFCRHGDD